MTRAPERYGLPRSPPPSNGAMHQSRGTPSMVAQTVIAERARAVLGPILGAPRTLGSLA